MKKTFLLSIAALAASASFASAQVQYLAGFDFSQYFSPAIGPIIDVPNVATTYEADLSELASSPNNYGLTARPYGKMYVDGSFGSDAISTTAGDNDIFTTTGSLGLGSNLGDVNSFDQGVTATRKQKLFAANDWDGGNGSIVFSATPGTAYKNFFIQFASLKVSGADETISVEFSKDGTNYDAVGTATVVASESLHTLSLAGVTDVVDDEVFFRLNWNNTSGAAAIDNVVIGGEVPEPSTYAAIFGAVALGVVALRRRLRK